MPAFILFQFKITLDLKLVLQIQNHGVFIAIREFDAFYAVTPDLVGQFRFVHQPEAMLAEKFRFVGQAKYPFKPEIGRASCRERVCVPV